MAPPRPRSDVSLALALAALAAAGCVASTAPRLPDSVAAAIAAEPMRRMESDDMILYYPERRRDEAVRFLGHGGACVSALRGRALGGSSMSRHKAVVILPEVPFNNAFVAPRAFGYEEEGVVPTVFTTDDFTLENGLPPDAATIACHEMTHFVHLEQIEGFSFAWNAIFGEAYTPQSGFDSWFDEGLAVYYETHLQPGRGRLAWPYWQGVFAAGVAGRRLGGGDLSVYDRDYDGGNNYLVGSHFVQFLADRYGEDRLWKLIDVQARSILFPFGVNVRFWRAYGKSLSTLIDEFAADVRARTPVLERPPDQRKVRDAGWSARYARARDGTEAIVEAERDTPTRLRVFAPDGRSLVERDLTDVIPPRDVLTSAPRVSGGLSFTADGRGLYFVAVDDGVTHDVAHLVRVDVRTGELAVLVDDLGGPGGSVSPDGRRYYFSRADGDRHDLAVLDLRTQEVAVLDRQPAGSYVVEPRVSPDGARLVVTTYDGARFGLALYDATTGKRLRAIPTGALVASDASWTDDGRIVFLGSPRAADGFQVHVLDLRDDSTTQLSRAPYLAFAPQATRGSVRFLNREGWAWTLDEIALPPPRALPPPEVAATPAPPADAPVAAVAPAMPPAIPPGEPPAAAPPAIVSDAPASALDRLFVPALRSPIFGTTSADDVLVGLSMSGADRLEQHRWTLTGFYETVTRRPSVSFDYTNRQLAPVTLSLGASQTSERQSFFAVAPSGATMPVYAIERDRTIVAKVSRALYGNPIFAGARFDERTLLDSVFDDAPMRLGGVYAGATFEGVESTPYTGTRRLFLASAYLATYPSTLGTLGTDLVDVRAEIAFTTPLPLLRRHRLSVYLVTRDVVGDSAPVMGVGGLPSSIVWRRPDASVPDPDTDVHLPFASFSESLRGFEDAPFATNGLQYAEAVYRYPFIIDWGSASTFGVLPSFFVRELDLNLYGVAARDEAPGVAVRDHVATVGSLSLSTVFGEMPLRLMYQITRRETDDHGLTQLLVLSN